MNINEQANFIWSIADLLRGDFKQSEYGKVILPFTLLRETFRELRECGYVKTQWADNIPYYLSLTVDGQNYFTNKKAAKKAEKKLSRREWRIAVISAIIGGMVGLIPWICTLIGGGQ